MHQLSISARGWDPVQDKAIRSVLQTVGITALETAPSKIGDPNNSTDEKIRAYRAFWADAGIEIIAMQSLFFGKQLNVFGGITQAQATTDHLKQMADVAMLLGAKYLVLGAYQSRKRGDLSLAEADDKFLAFLATLSEHLADRQVTLLLEAVPAAYGADYLTTHQSVWNMVNTFNHIRVRPLLDLGAAYTNQEDIRDKWVQEAPHIHLAVPAFGMVNQGEFSHDDYARALAQNQNQNQNRNQNRNLDQNCNQYLSIEMFEHALGEDPTTNLKAVLRFVKAQYQSA